MLLMKIGRISHRREGVDDVVRARAVDQCHETGLMLDQPSRFGAHNFKYPVEAHGVVEADRDLVKSRQTLVEGRNDDNRSAPGREFDMPYLFRTQTIRRGGFHASVARSSQDLHTSPMKNGASPPSLNALMTRSAPRREAIITSPTQRLNVALISFSETSPSFWMR